MGGESLPKSVKIALIVVLLRRIPESSSFSGS